MTMDAVNPVDRLIDVGGQRAFLLLLTFASLLGAIGFSLAIFGAFSGLLSSTFDQLMVIGIGGGLMALGGWLGYAALD